MLVKDIYDKVALLTGFPVYTNATDTPETTRFIVEMISQALQNVIGDLYTSNNVLERNDTIITIPQKELYGIKGTIKKLQLIRDDANKTVKVLPYNQQIDPDMIKSEDPNNFNEPSSYCIKNGYLRLFPTPDKEYTLKVCVSTTDLVNADDDSSRTTIESINDSIMATDAFCNLVIIKTAMLIFSRLQNNNAAIYAQYYESNLRVFIESDIKSMEAFRGQNRNGGHYNLQDGLINDEGQGFFNGGLF